MTTTGTGRLDSSTLSVTPSAGPDLLVIPDSPGDAAGPLVAVGNRSLPMSEQDRPAAPPVVTAASAPAASADPVRPAPVAVPEGDARTVRDLVAVAQRDISLLISKEVELAKAELAAAAKRSAIGGAGLVVAGLVAFFAMFGLLLTLGFGLNAAGLSLWVSFLVVTLVYLGLAGGAAILGGLELKKMTLPLSALTGAKLDLAAVRAAKGRKKK